MTKTKELISKRWNALLAKAELKESTEIPRSPGPYQHDVDAAEVALWMEQRIQRLEDELRAKVTK